MDATGSGGCAVLLFDDDDPSGKALMLRWRLIEDRLALALGPNEIYFLEQCTVVACSSNSDAADSLSPMDVAGSVGCAARLFDNEGPSGRALMLHRFLVEDRLALALGSNEICFLGHCRVVAAFDA